MNIKMDLPAQQAIAGCAVTLPSGPDRLAPMVGQLAAISERPEIGALYTASPILDGCRLLRGDPNIVYRVDEGGIELLVVQRGAAREVVRAAVVARNLELRSGTRKLTVNAVRSALLETQIGQTGPVRLRRGETHVLRAIVEQRVSRMDWSDAPKLFMFKWRGHMALGVWIPRVLLGIAVGAAREDQTDALEKCGLRELVTVRSVLERFGGC